MKKGILYIVATPIGNLEDITLRAIRTLGEVQLIAAEDTRRTKILLDSYGINTPVTSLHDHNELKKGSQLVAKLNEGTDIAYVSDAGTPGISDPGTAICRAAREAGVPVTVLPGASAVLSALVLSGVDSERFVFEGFLPRPNAERRARIASSRGSATSCRPWRQ